MARVLVVGFQFRAIGGLEIVSKSIASAVAWHGHEVRCVALHEAGAYLTDGLRVEGLLSNWGPVRFAQHRAQQFLLPKLLEPLIEESDIVIFAHAHVLKFLSAKRVKAKMVCWLHGREVWPPFLKTLAPQLSRMHSRVAVSEYTAKIVGATIGRGGDARVVPNPIDTDVFVPAESNDNVTRCRVLTVGRHDVDSFHKGYDALIEATGILSRNRPDLPIHLTITGTGPLLMQYADLISKFEVPSRVTLAGRVNRDELVRLYQTSDVFAFPSRVAEWRGQTYGEGFGLVNAEAAACGRPVITSTDGGCPETVVAGETGFVVDPRSPPAIAACLENVLGGAVEIRDAMGRRGREMVVARFSLPVFRNRIGTLLSDLENM